MNALDRPDSYDDAIATFVSLNEPEETRGHRRRLLKARDWSCRQLSNPRAVCGEALALYQSIQFHAARWCYALPATSEERAMIGKAAANCARLAIVAGSIQSMEAGDE